ncbi:hypothetical protein EG720_13680 [Salmonella enterica]|nr:hypothetical protein [Salmonella enterica]EAP1988651.1 hypothetical protein [Salmonella enterica subsp. enterica serovar Typhimurium var. 5-]EAY2967149.1 hypothetical protein [Salmonella enterica subsp. enterica serovar Typhimurium]ECV0052384.1 hypothetical protein [Salmonella enterica subsp. enterica serovar Newport]HAC6555115.1 hypothetical protein [Salmonella enterica subsp. enterica]
MKKDTLKIYLPDSVNENQCPEACDVIFLHRRQCWGELNDIPICIDNKGNVVARFGDIIWNLEPLVVTKNATHRQINFSVLKSHPSLLYEMKLICYGWLFTKNMQYSLPTKISTIIGRASGLKMSYKYLMSNSLDSISRICEPEIWGKYLNFLEEQKKSAGTLVHILCSLQQAYLLFPWMGLDYREIKFSPTNLSKKICRDEAIERAQTLAIPEDIADKLLHFAVNLVDTAWQYREQLGETERRIQENYKLGEQAVQNKIISGQWKWLTTEEGTPAFRHHFAKEAARFSPFNPAEIISELLTDYPDRPTDANGSWWHLQRGNLTSACFVCCAAFSGMRESELYELTSESYYNAVYSGRTFHFLKGKTHKMGERHTEWVVAPIVQKAVEVMSALTKHLREYLLQDASTARDKELAQCLWLSQGQRSTQPKRISCWALRLTNFSKYSGAIVSEKDYAECLRSNPNSQEKIKNHVHIGKHWALSPHQFRRTLAFFTIKNRLGNAIAIKQQFKHLYLQMSEWYCEGGIPSRLDEVEADKELQKMIDTVSNEQITQKYWSWFHGTETLSGSHGKDILKIRDDLPIMFRSWEKLYKLVKDKRITLHGTLHSYCKNGYDCEMEGVINPAFCIDCSTNGSIIDGEQAAWWKSKHNALILYLSENAEISTAVYIHCLTQIHAAEKVMSDFSIEYIPFQPEIEIRTDE